MTGDLLRAMLVPGTPPDVVARYLTLAERAKDAAFGLEEDEVVVLDTETTGFDPSHEELIQVAAAIMKGPETIARFSTFVNPHKPIPPAISELTGINDAMVAGAPQADQVVRELAAFVGPRDLIAHNARFDRNFIMRDARPGEFPGRWLDSLELARIALPRLRSHKMEDMSRAFGIHRSTHRADDDVEALCGVWRILLVALTDFPPGFTAWLSKLWPAARWDMRPTIAQVAAGLPDETFSLRMVRLNRMTSVHAPNKDDALHCVGDYPTERAVRSAFAAGSVVGAMYPGFEVREEQVLMAEEITRAFQTSTIRAIEAGTGVGKSIAYLLPAALTAKALGVGVGVATKTNALMDQLIYHELPALSTALDGGLSYVALKGYEHYPCLRKLANLAAENPDGLTDDEAHDQLTMIATVYAYLMQTVWGDLDAVNLYWRGLPRDRITASPGDCTRHRCPFYSSGCLLHGLRAQAKTADIVVTNHALLFRDIIAEGGILPPIRHWVVDEAHAAEEEARKQLSPQLRAADLFSALETLGGGHASLISNVRRKSRRMSGGEVVFASATKVEQQAQAVETIATSFFSFVKDLGTLAARSDYDSVDLWINAEVRETGPWGVVLSTGKALCDRLKSLIGSCRELEDFFEVSGSESLDLRSEIEGMACMLQDMREALILLLDGESPDYVYAASIDRNPSRVREVLSSSLLDVGAVLVADFYPQTLSVIYTSATIATGESFSHFEHAVGLDLLDRDSYATLKLDSSYDYDTNMRVFVPTDLPVPGDSAYLPALEELLRGIHLAMGGSTLTLFTNRREMERLYQDLRPCLEDEGIHLICQLRGTSMKRLRDEFLADDTTCLFALRSFWEGFDAPGDTLRCVVIPRLPFSRPNDPLERERELRDRGAWNRYALPEAVISLKQAAGRLVRTSTDRGYLVLADSRLVTKRYGKVFLDALPSSNLCLADKDSICRLIGEEGFGD